MNSSDLRKPIHIVGAGALGSLWACSLSAHTDVCFVDTRSARAARWIDIEFSKAFDPLFPPQHHRFSVRQPGELSASIELLLVCTKSYDALPTLQGLASALSTHAAIVLFQNGLGSQMTVLEHLPDARIYAAVSTEGAYRKGPNEVVHAGIGQTQIGALQPHIKVDPTLLEMLAASGLSIQATPEILAALWQKLLINCSINPFTALLNCRNGEIVDSDLFQQTWPPLRDELVELSQLAGYPVTASELEQRVFAVIHATAQNFSSMCQDIRLGRRTEIDDINGFAWRTLEQHGRSGAMNKYLWSSIHVLRH